MTSLLWVLVASAVGSERIDLAVEYEAPEACPPRARFEAELRARSDKLRLVSADAQATVSLRITGEKKKFAGTSRLRTQLSGVTTRQFKSAQCETLVQAAALATSLLLDPDGTKTGAVTVDLSPPPPEPAVLDAGVPLVDAGVVVEAPPPDAGAPPAPVDAGVPDVVLVPVDAGAAEPPAALHLELAVGGGVTSAVSGAVDVAPQLTIALQWSAVRLALSPSFLPGRSVTSPAGLARYLALGARLDALGSVFATRWLRLDVGLDVQVLGVQVSAPEAEVPGRALGWLVAPGPLGRVVFLVGPLRLAVEGGLGLNLRTERYVITGVGAVFAAPRLFGVVNAVVGWEL